MRFISFLALQNDHFDSIEFLTSLFGVNTVRIQNETVLALCVTRHILGLEMPIPIISQMQSYSTLTKQRIKI